MGTSNSAEPRYLLDTNILSALIRQPQGTAAAMLARRGYGAVCTSIVVAAELRFGARKRGSQILTGKVDDLLASLPVLPLLPLDARADRTYAEIRLQLEQTGAPIGPNDLLIAAHAFDAGLTLVTDNVEEPGRVAGLQVENWLDGSACDRP